MGATNVFKQWLWYELDVVFWQLPSAEAIAESTRMTEVCCPRRGECELVHVKITAEPNPDEGRIS